MFFRYTYSVKKEDKKDTDIAVIRAEGKDPNRVIMRGQAHLALGKISIKINKRKSFISYKKIIKELENKIATEYYKEIWRKPRLLSFEDEHYRFHYTLFEGQYSLNEDCNIDYGDEISFTEDEIMHLMKYKADWMKKTGWDKFVK